MRARRQDGSGRTPTLNSPKNNEEAGGRMSALIKCRQCRTDGLIKSVHSIPADDSIGFEPVAWTLCGVSTPAQAKRVANESALRQPVAPAGERSFSSTGAGTVLLQGTPGRAFSQRRSLVGFCKDVRDEQTFPGLCLDIAPSLFPIGTFPSTFPAAAHRPRCLRWSATVP